SCRRRETHNSNWENRRWKKCNWEYYFGGKGFESKSGEEAVTKKASFLTAERFIHKIVIVDTPGLADTNLTDNEVKAEVLKSFIITSPGPHAILLLVRPSRLSHDEVEILSKYQKFFGENFKKHLIIVFTDKDRLEKDGTTIEEYIGTLKHGSILKTLLNEVDNRYINIGYSQNFNDPDRLSEVKELISLILELKRRCGSLNTELTGKAEEIYDRIVELKIKKQQQKMSETTYTKYKIEEWRDYARGEFLEYFLGVSVDAFVRTFQGNYTEFTYGLLNTIYLCVG
ncbi:GTPase IMAP member 4, partial [Bonamia ostreae]